MSVEIVLRKKAIEVYDWRDISDILVYMTQSSEVEVSWFAFDVFDDALRFAENKVIVDLSYVNPEWIEFDIHGTSKGLWSKKILDAWNELYFEIIGDETKQRKGIAVEVLFHPDYYDLD